jgi:hypothetical protein
MDIANHYSQALGPYDDTAICRYEKLLDLIADNSGQIESAD